MIGVIDYEAGNLASVGNALKAIEASFIVSADLNQLKKCSGILLPGVGAAQLAMQSLERRNLVEFVQTLERPFLGICLGMQLLYNQSEEGNTKCLGIIPGAVKKFSANAYRVPHMGWNEVHFTVGNPLAEMLGGKAHFYFAHSYYAPVGSATSAVSECGVRFSAAVRRGNYFGVQFHPEKSGTVGLRLLKSFYNLCELFQQ